MRKVYASDTTELTWEAQGLVDTAKASRIGALEDHTIDLPKGHSHAMFRLRLSAHDSPQFQETLCSVQMTLVDRHTSLELAFLIHNDPDPRNPEC